MQKYIFTQSFVTDEIAKFMLAKIFCITVRYHVFSIYVIIINNTGSASRIPPLPSL